MPSIDSLANLAYSTIESINGNGDGTALDFVDEVRFPDPATNGPYNVVVKHDDGEPATVANAEIMRVTAKSGATFTVMRDQESTTGITCVVGDIVFITTTVANLKQALHWEHISTVTLTDDATADFVLQNSVYKSYLFVLENIHPANDDVVPWLRTDSNGGASFDAGASDYQWAHHRSNTTPSEGTGGDVADSEIELAVIIGTTATEVVGATVWLFNPADVDFTLFAWQLVWTYNGVVTQSTGGGARLSAAVVDAVQFLMSAGNIASGKIAMYGLKHD